MNDKARGRDGVTVTTRYTYFHVNETIVIERDRFPS